MRVGAAGIENSVEPQCAAVGNEDPSPVGAGRLTSRNNQNVAGDWVGGQINGSRIDEGLYADDAVHGIDQSETAVAEIATRLPGVRVGDIEAEMPYADGSMGVIIVAEVIEHLVHPWALFDRVHRVLRSGGVLLLSFPNYLHLPWLALRILADLCDRPAWIVLQPIDRMYTTPLVKRRLRERGFDIEAIIGNTYGPPKLHEWEPRWLRALLNGAHLGELSFHPVLVCRKR